MSEELEQLLKNLKLWRMLEIYEEQPDRTATQDLSNKRWNSINAMAVRSS